jgi:hypothetical protein
MGGSIFVALGFAALVTSNCLNSFQLDTGTFLKLWTATILVPLLGFVVILAGFLTASSGRTRRLAGGAMGVFASIIGAFVSIILITTTAGVDQTITSSLEYNASYAQFSVAYSILTIGSIIALFFGFPLGMFGSMPAIVEKEQETIPTE